MGTITTTTIPTIMPSSSSSAACAPQVAPLRVPAAATRDLWSEFTSTDGDGVGMNESYEENLPQLKEVVEQVLLIVEPPAPPLCANWIEPDETDNTSSGDSATGTVVEDSASETAEDKEEEYNTFPAEPPLHDPSPQDTDKMLAKEMYDLSINEREHAAYDLHGVAIPEQEQTPSFLQQQLEQLEVALQRIPRAKKKAFQTLLHSNANSYISTDKFRLAFLRADEFHAPRAAKRLVLFLEGKQKLFGTTLLAKEIITLEDVYQLDNDKDANDCNDGDNNNAESENRVSMESGFFQLLPFRDGAGRAIITGIPGLRNAKKIESVVRILRLLYSLYIGE
jgi:hypothetical protein